MIKNNWLYIKGDPTPKGVIENGTYKSTRRPKEHFYVKRGGYPVADEIIRWLIEHNVNDIIIVEKCMKGDRHLKTTVWAYMREELFQEPPYEPQRCVPLKKMRVLSG